MISGSELLGSELFSVVLSEAKELFPERENAGVRFFGLWPQNDRDLLRPQNDNVCRCLGFFMLRAHF